MANIMAYYCVRPTDAKQIKEWQYIRKIYSHRMTFTREEPGVLAAESKENVTDYSSALFFKNNPEFKEVSTTEMLKFLGLKMPEIKNKIGFKEFIEKI